MGKERGGLRAMARSSLFEGFPPQDLENIPLLLDRVAGRLGSDIDRLEVQVKGRLSDQECRLKNLEGRLEHQENSPCQVHRDAAHQCPSWRSGTSSTRCSGAWPGTPASLRRPRPFYTPCPIFCGCSSAFNSKFPVYSIRASIRGSSGSNRHERRLYTKQTQRGRLPEKGRPALKG